MDMTIAKHQQLVRCHTCAKLSRLQPNRVRANCPRCGSEVSLRITSSISKTWCLLITATIALLFANIYPVMTVMSFGHGEADTIMSGVIELMHAKMYPIAFLVFFASVLVPVFKIIGLAGLLLLIQLKCQINHSQALAMYRFIHFIGRWSMLDLFMISILVALVDLGNIASIQTGHGATAFATVVVVTMFAAHTFDQRLIWDLMHTHKELEPTHDT